jgi:TrbL/VirB6 plasmid conjugal transfer protein
MDRSGRRRTQQRRLHPWSRCGMTALSVGFIFLGFGGSRWTAPYTERYIGLAVSIGIKIVLSYCLLSESLKHPGDSAWSLRVLQSDDR